MKPTLNKSPHKTFATYFDNPELEPFLFALSKKMSNGHICIDIGDLDKSNEFWEEYAPNFDPRNSFPTSSEIVSTSIEEIKPFTLFDNRLLYTGRNFHYETLIIEKLKEFSKLDEAVKNERIEKLKAHLDFIIQLQSLDEDIDTFSKEEKPDWQLVAAIHGVLNNITIVTGGPGTGKTTTVAKILALLYKVDPKLKIALTAPTGKAAIRMKESLLSTASDEKNAGFGIKKFVEGLEPKTIHRLLGTKHLSPFFKHNEANPLDYDVVIVDESSMIGVGLFAKLLSAIKDGARVILLGDPDQLASVDSGSLFGDLCKALKANENKYDEKQLTFLNQFIAKERVLGKEYLLKDSTSFLDQHLVRLKKTYRYEQDSKMGKFTKAVIEGNVAQIDETLKMTEESLVLDESYDKKLLEEFVQDYSAYIEEENTELALEKINALRVLCTIRNGEQGIYELNRKIAELLKLKYKEQKKEKLFSPKDGFYHNQPIMVTRNMTSMNLFNGDVGIVRKDTDGNLMAFFPPVSDEKNNKKGLIKISPYLITEWETVFAMTIHKSQGSEFDEVLVILPQKGGSELLTSELLYTGVTRAKNKAIIQSSLELIKQTAIRRVDRVSGIQERIK